MARLLTRKGEQTRARIIVNAAADVRERGVDEVRLEDVMALSNTSKGQLFHYFPGGKEELLLAVMRYEAEQVLTDQEPMLSNLTSWEAWQDWRDQLISRYLAQGMMCPLNGLLGPTGRRAPGAAAVLNDLMRRWQSAITDGIRYMQATGDISADVEAEQAGAAILAGIQGGALLMLSSGSIDHLVAALDFAIGNLRASGRVVVGAPS